MKVILLQSSNFVYLIKTLLMQIFNFIIIAFHFISLLNTSPGEKTNDKIELSEISSKYFKIFGNDYKDALSYFKSNKILINKILKNNNIDSEIVIPVLFPERIRFSIVKNYFETAFLEAIYTRHGSDYVDFSIGDFQMKPSFIEKLENRISENVVLNKKYSKLLIEKDTKKEERKERIKRLKATNYQLLYISLFYDIVNMKFDTGSKSKSEKIIFFAAAYNHGFETSKKEIEKYIKVKYFPYGTSYPGEQYSYCDVSADFYKNYYFKIFKKN